MRADQQDEFLFSLLKGLSWLSGREVRPSEHQPGVSPLGSRAPRGADPGLRPGDSFRRAEDRGGKQQWAGPEQQQNHSPGQVTDRDDLWGAGEVLYYLHAGAPMANQADLDDFPALKPVVSKFICQPHERPAPREVLTSLNVSDPVPAELRYDPLEPGRQRFRAIKVPGNSPPDGASRDERSGGQSSVGAPARGQEAGGRAGAWRSSLSRWPLSC